MVAVSMEGHDEEGWMVVEGVIVGDSEEEVFMNVFVLRTPDLLTVFIDNGVLVGVVGDDGGTGRGGEEMGEELSFQGNREWEVREFGSGQSGRGNDSDRGFSDGWQEVLDGDVGKWDMLNDFFKLKVDIGVLVFGGWGVLKLRAYNVSLLGSNVGEDMENVGQGGNDREWGWGAIGIEAHGKIITTWAGVVPGVVGTIEVVLDDLVGSDDVDLIGIVNLRPIGNREGRGDNEGG
jgi:hypothetical protein